MPGEAYHRCRMGCRVSCGHEATPAPGVEMERLTDQVGDAGKVGDHVLERERWTERRGYSGTPPVELPAGLSVPKRFAIRLNSRHLRVDRLRWFARVAHIEKGLPLAGPKPVGDSSTVRNGCKSHLIGHRAKTISLAHAPPRVWQSCRVIPTGAHWGRGAPSPAASTPRRQVQLGRPRAKASCYSKTGGLWRP